MRKLAIAIVALGSLLAACSRMSVAPEVLQQYQSRTLYTCCNLRYESDRINDANYQVGTILPFGTPVKVLAMTGRAITFDAGGVKLTLEHAYGVDQESGQQYFDKILVSEDPKATVAGYPEPVRNAIREARVEVGMTREQVIASIGYPPTHRTASLSSPEWTYWYNRWVTFKVVFDDAGKVSRFVGSNVPTSNQPIVTATPSPTKAPAKPAGKRR